MPVKLAEIRQIADDLDVALIPAGYDYAAKILREAADEIEASRARDVGENEGGEGIIKPGDFVNYDGDERLVRRYVGKASNGFDVVEAVPGYSFTTWMPGMMRLHQPAGNVGASVG